MHQRAKNRQGSPIWACRMLVASPAPADPLTRHTIALGYHWYIPETAGGSGDVSNKRRLLAKLALQFQALGLTGQEPAQNFILHLYRRNCRQNTLLSYGGGLRLFLEISA